MGVLFLFTWIIIVIIINYWDIYIFIIKLDSKSEK